MVGTVKIGTVKISRRSAMTAMGAAAASIGMPWVSRAQATADVKILESSGAPLLAWAASYLAEAQGFFKDEGLKVERVYNNSGPVALTALVAGSGTVIESTPSEFLVASSKGQPLKTMIALSNFNEFYLLISKDVAAKHGVTADSPRDKRLAVVKELKGGRFGISAPGAQTDVTLRAILRANGINPNTDVQLIPLGATVNSLAAMGRGAIDAFMASPPVPELAAAQFGAVALINQGSDDIPALKKVASHGMQARAPDVEARPEVYRGIAKGVTRAIRLIVESPKEAGDVIYKAAFSKAVTPELWPVVWEHNRDQFRSPYVTPEQLEAWITQGLVPGLTDPKAVKASELVDMRFVDEAVKAIGWKVPA